MACLRWSTKSGGREQQTIREGMMALEKHPLHHPSSKPHTKEDISLFSSLYENIVGGAPLSVPCGHTAVPRGLECCPFRSSPGDQVHCPRGALLCMFSTWPGFVPRHLPSSDRLGLDVPQGHRAARCRASPLTLPAGANVSSLSESLSHVWLASRSGPPSGTGAGPVSSISLHLP